MLWVWVNLESAMPGERSQSQKTTDWMIPLIGSFQSRQIHGDGKHISGCHGVKGGRVLNKFVVSFGAMGMFWNEVEVVVV